MIRSLRRLAAFSLLAAQLLGSVAQAKILVVWDYGEAAPGDRQAGPIVGMESRQNNAIYDVLRSWNVDYRLVSMAAMRTEWLRTGSVTWDLGTAAARVESFNAVVVINFGNQKRTAQIEAGNKPWPATLGCLPCSLGVGGAAELPTVPILMLFGADNGDASSSFPIVDRAGSVSLSACTTGVSDQEIWAGQGAASPLMLINKLTGLPYMSSANTGGYIINSTAPTGGLRPWIVGRVSHSMSLYRYSHIQSANADTIYGSADTLTMWERPFNNVYGGAANTLPGKPIIYANVMGAATCNDSVGNVVPCEFQEGVLLTALARLDSLTGGKVFRGPPKRAAIVISGGLQHNRRTLYGGIPPDDSTVLKASLDSLQALGVPLTVTIATDSLATYPNEAAWWKKLTNARFVPTVPTGNNAFDSSRVAGNWTTSAPYDVYGRFRFRTFYGDSSAMHTYSGVANDSSIYQGLLEAGSTLRSYGLPRSGCIVAPFDDWTPKNFFYGKYPNPMDSLTWVFQRLGYTAALTDVQRPEANASRNKKGRDLVQGWDGKQFSYRNGITNINFNFIGHTGYGINGSGRNFMYTTDSTAVPLAIAFGGGGPTYAPVPFAAVARFWHGLCHDDFLDIDWFQYDGMSNAGGYADIAYPLADGFYRFHRSSVLKLHVSDLGGIPNGPPTRPGWWAIKSLVREFQAINATAGRTIIVFDYPENITP